MIDLQVTLFDKSGKYKPVSTIIPIESVSYYNLNKKEVKGLEDQLAKEVKAGKKVEVKISVI